MEGGWVHKGYAAFSLGATMASVIQSFHAWFWCLFIFSWASKLLNRPSKWLTYLNEAVYPTYIMHMHLTFLPIAIFGILGIGYYIGLALGTFLVMLGVMVCFEVIRHATYARAVYGIKGGHDKVSELFLFQRANSRSSKILLCVTSHGLAISITIGLLISLIGAGFLKGG